MAALRACQTAASCTAWHPASLLLARLATVSIRAEVTAALLAVRAGGSPAGRVHSPRAPIARVPHAASPHCLAVHCACSGSMAVLGGPGNIGTALCLLLLAVVGPLDATAQLAPLRSEVVAFYGQDAQPTCTPSYWLDFPPGTVTTIIMQGWLDPFMIAYAHRHDMRVLMAAGCTGSNMEWCTKLASPAARAAQVNATVHAARSAGYDGIGWDLEAISLPDQATLALFIPEVRRAWPEGFQSFYVGNLQHRAEWEAPAVSQIAPFVDLVIVSAYSETNDTAGVHVLPGQRPGPGRTACVRPCGTTSLPTIESALTSPDGWAAVVNNKSKLVMALGWYHLQSMKNLSAPPYPPLIPAQLGWRISFCQAVSLAKTLPGGLGSRRFDNASSTWVFDCDHDAANASTFQGCGPWPDAIDPVTTEICEYMTASMALLQCHLHHTQPPHHHHRHDQVPLKSLIAIRV